MRPGQGRKEREGDKRDEMCDCVRYIVLRLALPEDVEIGTDNPSAVERAMHLLFLLPSPSAWHRACPL